MYYNLDAIKSVSCVDISLRYGIELKQIGNMLTGRLRNEKTPSFKIYQNTNTWYDFGSGKGGNSVNLVCEILQVEPKEAIEIISKEFGIEPIKRNTQPSENGWQIPFDSLYRKIGIDPTDVFTNIQKYSNLNLDNTDVDKLVELKNRYGITIQELYLQNKDTYINLLKKWSTEYLKSLINDYTARLVDLIEFGSKNMNKEETIAWINFKREDINKKIVEIHEAEKNIKAALPINESSTIFDVFDVTNRNLSLDIDQDLQNIQEELNKKRADYIAKNAEKMPFIKSLTYSLMEEVERFIQLSGRTTTSLAEIQTMKSVYKEHFINLQNERLKKIQEHGSDKHITVREIDEKLRDYDERFSNCNKILIAFDDTEIEGYHIAAEEAGAASEDHQEPTRYYINCPFREKDEAKALGATWDKYSKSWYFTKKKESYKFQKWITSGEDTPGERSAKDKAVDIADQLKEGVANVFKPDKYQDFLNTIANFPTYSLNNTLLIHMQFPTASLVTTYAAFEHEYGHKVKKGEKSFQLLRPNKYNKSVEAALKDIDRYIETSGVKKIGRYCFEKNDDGSYLISFGFGNTRAIVNEISNKKWVREFLKDKVINKEFSYPPFLPYNVFDVSQTTPIMIKDREGNEVPDPKSKKIVLNLPGDVKEGNLEDIKLLYESVARTSIVPITYDPSRNGENGYYSSSEQRINITPTGMPTKALKTLVHELANSRLHNQKYHGKTREQKEVEAESIAYIVCKYYGVDTSNYSFGYAAQWSTDKDITILENALDTIKQEAVDIIREVDYHIEQLNEKDLTTEAKHLGNIIFVTPDKSDSPGSINEDIILNAEELIIDGELEPSLNNIPRTDIEEMALQYAISKIDEYDLQIMVLEAKVYGSRTRGLEHENSDIDVVISFEGDIGENVFLNILHEEEVEIGGMIMDITPIREDISGTIDEFIKRANECIDTKTNSTIIEQSVDHEPLSAKTPLPEKEESIEEALLQELKVTFFVAECMDNKESAMVYSDFASFDDAKKKFNDINSKLGKGIGIYIEEPGGKSYDIYYPLESFSEIIERYIDHADVEDAVNKLGDFYNGNQTPDMYWARKKLEMDALLAQKSGENIKVQIYQLKKEKTREFGGRSYNDLTNIFKKGIDKNNYNLVASTTLKHVKNKDAIPATIYEIGNTSDTLQKFTLRDQEQRSISISDIIAVTENYTTTFFYVDSIGFKKLRYFEALERPVTLNQVDKFLELYRKEPLLAITDIDTSIKKPIAQIMQGIHAKILPLPTTNDDLQNYIINGKSMAEAIFKTSKYATVQIVLSENPNFKKGEILSFREANQRVSAQEIAIKRLREEKGEDSYHGYDKTEFTIFFWNQDELIAYSARLDIGDKNQSDLLEFIEKSLLKRTSNIQQALSFGIDSGKTLDYITTVRLEEELVNIKKLVPLLQKALKEDHEKEQNNKPEKSTIKYALGH